MARHRLPLLFLALSGCGPGPTPQDEPDPGTNEVLAVAQSLFDVLATRDTAALRALMLPSGTFVAVGSDGVRVNDVERLTASLSAGGPRLLERMWDPAVRVEGGIATVWTPYDFHRDGTFSHCGIDAFQLVKADDGAWRVASVIYTVQTEACGPSPLGPPPD